MKRMLFNATHHEELRVALVDGKKLINFDIETNSKLQRRGNIYCGVITRVEPSLEACFVDYGTDKQGFLPFKEIDSIYISESAKHRDFTKLKEGTKVIIQVEKDERGNKGAALTTYASLPGRYLVLIPNNPRSGGISRRIGGDERDELKSVLSELTFPAGMSVIARTAALGRVTEELQWDLNYLLKLWDAIRNAAEQHDRFLIYQESNLVIRSIRDHFSSDVEEILIDEERVFTEAQNFMASIMPHFVDRIKHYHDDVQLFSRFQIEHQIETAYSRTVNLPSGGAIVIDHTEALTAIDVNSAKSNKGADIEATAFTTNLEAADEIARQLRLRDLGGLVVVDFIDMENQRNQREVENFFKSQLTVDRARIQMGKLSKFGLLELSRQRLKASLEESTTISCPRCFGVGAIRGIESIAVHILRIIQEEAVKNSNHIAALHVQLPVEVATYLLNEKREDVVRIENRMNVQIVLIPNVHMDSPQYKIKKIGNDSYEFLSKKHSFSLVESIQDISPEFLNKEKKTTLVEQKAVVKGIMPSTPAPVTNKSLFDKIVDKLSAIFKANPQSNQKSNIQNKNTNKPLPQGPFKSNNSRYTNNNNQIPTKPHTQVNKMVNTKDDINNNTNPSRSQNAPTNRTNTYSKNVNNQTSKTIPSSQPIYTNVMTEKIDTKIEHTAIHHTANIVEPVKNSNVDASNKQPIKNITNHPNESDCIVAPSVSNIQVTQMEKNQPPKIEVRNTILDDVDLGDLLLVNTDKNFVSKYVIPVIAPIGKRYNDIPKAQPIDYSTLEYILVETKIH